MQAKEGRWFCALITGLVAVLMALPVSAGEKQGAEDRVAVVNGSVITRKDLDREVSRSRQQLLKMGRTVSKAQLPEMRKRTLENLIAYELLYQESKKKKIKVAQVAIDERMKQLKQQYPSEAEFKAALSALNLSEADVISHVERGMAIEQLVDQELMPKVTISDEETRSYYDANPNRFKQPEQVRASHILISVESGADASQKAEARKKLEKIQKQIQKGEGFAALAKEHSGCPSSAKGGDLGYFGRGQMAKPFEEATFALKPNQVSDIVETRFGYHLIKLMDKKPPTTIPYEDVKDRLGQQLKQQKMREEVLVYVEGLKQKAEVERFLAEDPVKKSPPG